MSYTMTQQHTHSQRQAEWANCVNFRIQAEDTS
jgi:hypothetical protein